MPVTQTYLTPPTADERELVATFAPIFDRIAEGNADRERDRVFPHEQVGWLKEAGFGTLRIPQALGGLGASLEQTFWLLALLGEADANVSHIWRNHSAFVEDRLNAPASASNDVWIERFLAGEFVGGGWTEANNVSLANLKTTVTREDGHWVVSGAKYYATGSLYADWLDVLGADHDGTWTTALVRADQDGVELVDDWRGFGQRTTASGTANYDRARAEEGDVFPAADRFAYQGHFYQTAMLSILTGIARAAHRDGTAVLTTRTRTYPQGLGDDPRRDAQMLQVIGELSAHPFAAEGALRAAARSLDDIAGARGAGADDDEVQRLVIEGEVATSRAQSVIIDAALRATTALFDALGSSAVSERLLLDRHWRNARTLASHNPRVYKARLLGDWYVNGANPVPVFVEAERGGQGI